MLLGTSNVYTFPRQRDAILRNEKLIAEARGQFGDREEEKHALLDVATKQRLIKTGKGKR
jgi:hypothetical protein